MLRDVLNLALGNTDNHVRNTSVLKTPDGRVALSPIYDLAPMIIDRDGIPRVSRWGSREPSMGRVDWNGVVDDLKGLGAEESLLRRELGRMGEFVASLHTSMASIGIEASLIERLRRVQLDLAADLSRVAS
jgi:serine/threonine-protein kinase HipA